MKAFTKTVLASAISVALYSAQASAIDFFQSAPAVDGRSIQADAEKQVNLEIFQQPVGTELNITLPEGLKVLVVSDRTQEENSVTLVGYIKGENHETKSVFVFNDDLVYGKIQTQQATYLVNTSNVNSFFQEEALPEPEGGTDQIMIPESVIREIQSHKQLSRDVLRDIEVANSTEVVTVDVMIVYSDEYASLKGSGLKNTLDYLIQMTNQAYKDSGVLIQLRLVKTKNVAYADSTSINTALSDLFSNLGKFTGLEAERTAAGADLVVFVRGYNGGSACGLAYVTGSNGSVAGYGRYAYSVIESGSKNGYSCGDLSFSHEIGHNFGATHNIENSQGPGVFSYSYGYGINGVFGDIMSYYQPRVAKFSNPDVICSGTYKCGIANQADVARSFNATRFEVSSWKAAQSTPVTPPATTVAVAVTKTGEGVVTSTDGKIACGSTCNTSYPSSSNQITLNAVPAAGWSFAGWSQDCIGTASCNLSLASSKNATATFTLTPKPSYTLVVSKTGTGTGVVNSPDAKINCGTVCSTNVDKGTTMSLTSNASAGSKFLRWEGACTGTSPTCSVVVNGATAVNAVYEAAATKSPTVKIYVGKSTLGNILSTDGKVNCGSKGTACTVEYPKNATVTIQATATDPKMKFKQWGQDCYGTAPVCKLTMNVDKVVGFTYTSK